MNLNEYIKEVISQISDAIVELNDGEKINKTVVNPSMSILRQVDNDAYCVIKQSPGTQPLHCRVVNVDFDVSLTSSIKKDGGGKLSLSVIDVGTTKVGQSAQSNNVKFSLPVIFASVEQPNIKE